MEESGPDRLPELAVQRNIGYRPALWLWIWLPLTIVLDVLQFLFFDCSNMPLLSLLFGLPTFGAIAALPVVIAETWMHPTRSAATKLLMSVLAIMLLAAVACLAGVCMLFTHLCS